MPKPKDESTTGGATEGTSEEKAPNLPKHKDRGTAIFLRSAHEATIVHRGGPQGGEMDPETGELRADAEPLNQFCPVKGCGYPIVSRLLAGKTRDGQEMFEVKPATWTGKYLRICLWDPEHFREEVTP